MGHGSIKGNESIHQWQRPLRGEGWESCTSLIGEQPGKARYPGLMLRPKPFLAQSDISPALPPEV